MVFEFSTANRILFGSGTVADVAPLAANLGRRTLLVVEGDGSRAQPLAEALAGRGLEVTLFAVNEEPTVSLVMQGVEAARAAACDVAISLGGGSVIDAGKAITALLTNDGAPLDYLEVIGLGKPLSRPPAPFVAVPTTAGTGAEVTRNAVLKSEEHSQKVSLRSPMMLPRVAVVDPELTYSMPPDLTASTGLDALTQLLEPFVARQANPITDGFCREGLLRAGRSLRRVVANGQDAAGREDMALASLLGGLALANAKLGAVHGFAGVIGGLVPAPHGVVCARLLPSVMAANVQALQERDPQGPYLDRYAEVAQILTGDMQATAREGVAWVAALCSDLDVPGLGAFGLTAADIPLVVAKTSGASSTKGNPVVLTDAELTAILEQAL